MVYHFAQLQIELFGIAIESWCMHKQHTKSKADRKVAIYFTAAAFIDNFLFALQKKMVNYIKFFIIFIK